MFGKNPLDYSVLFKECVSKMIQTRKKEDFNAAAITYSAHLKKSSKDEAKCLEKNVLIFKQLIH